MDLDDDAQRVYRAMLTDSSRGVAALAGHLGMDEDRVRKALDTLADGALLHPDATDPMLLQPTHPRVGLARLMADAEAALVAQQQRVSAMRAVMESIAAEHDSLLDRESVIVHRSLDAIHGRLEQLALEARVECVSLNPGRAHRPEAMAASKPLNQLALERGVAIRCVYQESFRNDAATLAYAQWLTDLGGRARTVPNVPMLMVLVDQEVALLPRVVEDGSQGGLELRAPSVVGALSAWFETVWSIADDFGRPRATEAPLENATTRELLQLMSHGATDESAARRLGLSSRTVRRLMSQAMASLGAGSRFQAGVEASRRGWVK